MTGQWHAKLPVLGCLAKKLVDISRNPRERQWLHQRLSLAWSEGAPPAYWPVCMFDLISATLSALTSVPACHLPLSNV